MKKKVLAARASSLRGRRDFGPRCCASYCAPVLFLYARRLCTLSVTTAGTASDNPKKFLLEKIADQLGVKKLPDWYTKTKQDVIRKGGRELFDPPQRSLDSILQEHYPRYAWRPDQFLRERGDSWRHEAAQRKFLEQIAPQLGVKELSDWYGVTRRQVIQLGGGGLFLYHTSVKEALERLYPDYPWEPHKFIVKGNKAPKGYWKDTKNLLAELQRVELKLGITKPEDWYSVTLADMKELGCHGIKRPQLIELLVQRYPLFEWDPMKILRGRFAQQYHLERTLDKIFPNVPRGTNVRKEAGLIYPDTGDYMELDIYFPSLKLAFEFQEKHHYMSQDNIYTPLEKLQSRDKIKKEFARAKGITVIVVPYWWDGQRESLIATIQNQRPELLFNEDIRGFDPIPEEAPPHRFRKDIPSIDGIGQPTTAIFFTLSKVDPTNWWMFEKYDGIRGFWNPEKRAFYSRFGNKLPFPKEVTDVMPNDTFLDGEIWFGRDNFQEALKLSNRVASENINWNQFKYVVFDLPNHRGTYQERYDSLVEFVNEHARDNKYLMLAEKQECTNIEHLEQFFQDIIDEGGEGVILRDPKAPYQAGRSPGYLKHKKYRDAEARVVSAVAPGRWECELPDGARFVAPAGTSAFLKKCKLQEGDIVSFKHHGFLLSSRKPKLPTIYRKRDDLTWETVVANWKEQKSTPTAAPIFRQTRTHMPKGYWANQENQQKFFIEFAQQMGFDPYEPNNWTTVSKQQIFSLKGFGPIGNKSLIDSLRKAFPEIQWPLTYQHNSWKDKEKCRQLLIDFAQERGFDPFDADQWYRANLNLLLGKKGGFALRSRYNGLRNAVVAVFPELTFNKWIPPKDRLPEAPAASVEASPLSSS